MAAQMYDVTIRIFIEVDFDEKPTTEELRKALYENAIEYLGVVEDADGIEGIVDGKTSIGFTYRKVAA